MPLVAYYIQFRYVKYYDCKLFLLEKEKRINISYNLIKISEASVFTLQICFMLLLTVCLLLERLDAKSVFYFFSFYILI